MPRRKAQKPKGKERWCWAWKKREKSRGEAAEAAGDLEAAERHRCHGRPRPAIGRCRWHGGTSKQSPAHHRFKHGAFSKYFVGILKAGARFYDEVQVLASLRDELAVNKALIAHKLGEVNAAGPSDEAWLEMGRMTTEIERLRDAGDRQGMAALLTTRDELIKTQCSSVKARRELDPLLQHPAKAGRRRGAPEGSRRRHCEPHHVPGVL